MDLGGINTECAALVKSCVLPSNFYFQNFKKLVPISLEMPPSQSEHNDFIILIAQFCTNFLSFKIYT